VVATWLAAVRLGRAGLSAPAGVYVSASLKEEFGIAILEALASGLVVVAPAGGGPATYVEHGVTGLLVDTTSAEVLASAVVAALGLASAPDAADRAQHARDVVTEQFSITTMASSLATVYSEVTRDAARHQS
jgi:glycosyltransferase involved in cell wall biosynthesis